MNLELYNSSEPVVKFKKDNTTDKSTDATYRMRETFPNHMDSKRKIELMLHIHI